MLAIGTHSAPVHADTLGEAIAKAYTRNPALQATRSLSKAADEAVVQAKAAYGPTIGITASHTYTTSRTSIPGISVSEHGFATDAEISLSQPLFTSGRLGAGVDAATAEQLVAREELRAQSQKLILDVVDAYVSLRRDIELYGVACDIYRLLLQQRDTTSARLRLRDATEPDVAQTENRMQLAAGRVIAARAGVEASAARYRNVVGNYPETLEPLPTLVAPPTLETLYVEAESNSPALLASKFTELRSRATLAAARAERGPSIDAFASARRTPLSDYENDRYTKALIAGVSLSMPLYTSGRITSSVREAIARNEADQQLIEQARRDVRESIADDWNLLLSADQSQPRYDAAVRAAQSAVDGVKQQETAGIRTLRDVLDVTNDLLTARTSAAQTEADAYIRKVAVLRDAGLLDIAMFEPQIAYDPDAYHPPLAALAGLPLRPLIGPIDRLLLNQGVKPANVDRENAATYRWPATVPDPLAPEAGK
ncbi:TolC family outer membrane protein [Novosphingobium sp. BL-8A]|uniref:TolC family outer membrane protein n=1 Tax=Novosphingobium sp. BL-8A TaxID=3127639 RepID=UPI00375728F2